MNTDINQIAKTVRETLKKEFPTCKFSVRLHKYSGGRSMTVSLMSAPFDAMLESPSWEKGYSQLNQYTLSHEYPENGNCNGANLTPEAWKVMSRAVEIANAENWDNSDSMTDYFDVNYYLHIQIGQWDKPFVKK